jgi:hypothetical protein
MVKSVRPQCGHSGGCTSGYTDCRIRSVAYSLSQRPATPAPEVEFPGNRQIVIKMLLWLLDHACVLPDMLISSLKDSERVSKLLEPTCPRYRRL